MFINFNGIMSFCASVQRNTKSLGQRTDLASLVCT